MLLTLATAAPGASTTPPMVTLSADGTHLVDERGSPFFMNGDTAWSLIAGVSKEDAERYLEDRRRKGFNLVLVNLIEHSFSPRPPLNHDGEPPFRTAGGFRAPNEAYFAHADWVIRTAHEKGIVVLLAPLYLGYDCSDDGWCAEIKASSIETMRDYGRYVGRRYKSYPNVIWLIGGDMDPWGAPRVEGLRDWLRLGTRLRGFLAYLRTGDSGRAANDVGEKVRAFVAGLKEQDRHHLLAAHNWPEQAGVDPWPQESWLNLNTVYTYQDAHLMARAQFERRPFKPFFLLETYYENEHGSTPLSLRRQAYWSVLSGGILGHVFGNCQIWGFSFGYCRDSWQAQLDSAGSTTVAHVGRLFESRPFFRLMPDRDGRLLTRGRGYGPAYATAARTTDGSTAIVYIPTGRAVTIDLSQLTGHAVKSWWFDPRTAQASPIGRSPRRGSRAFTPPDAADWVLVIDDASLEYPPPGTPPG